LAVADAPLQCHPMIDDTLLSRAAEREVLTVAQLNARAKRVLETQFPLVWVEGELSNFAAPRSGHWYFTLKDEHAQIRSAMFRSRNITTRCKPKDGLHVLLRARLSLFEERGDYQLIVDHMEEAGVGRLQRAFEQLKAKLATEGLFDADRKRPLPPHPKHVGVITSATGAAIHDILTVFARRFPSTVITLLPVTVQGTQAAPEICAAIRDANRFAQQLDPPLEVLIVGRGGGSLEDLWAFNEETVARAIADSELPIVSAVGHEIDFSIADFVADVRAPTPSAAAELLSPDQFAIAQRFDRMEQALTENILGLIYTQQEKTANLRRHIRHPGEKLAQQRMRIAHGEKVLINSMLSRLTTLQHRIERAGNVVDGNNPQLRIVQHQSQVAQLAKNLQHRIETMLASRQAQLNTQMQVLNTVSPLATLQRGYAIVLDNNNDIVRDVNQVQSGDAITARVANGNLLCTVQERIDSTVVDNVAIETPPTP